MVNEIWSAITIIVMCVVILVGCDNMKFNQETNKNDLLTEKYSIVQIEELKSAADFRNITFTKFKKDFNVQCVRKTHQGCYVVLLLEDERNAFVFFNKENILNRVMISDGFKSKVEFQNHVTEQMPKSEVLNFDLNTIFVPVSAVDITVHIVQEGAFIVKYTRFVDGKSIEDPVVSSIEFIENKSLSTNTDAFIRDQIPFVFEIDKVCK